MGPAQSRSGTQARPTLCGPADCSRRGSSVPGVPASTPSPPLQPNFPKTGFYSQATKLLRSPITFLLLNPKDTLLPFSLMIFSYFS